MRREASRGMKRLQVPAESIGKLQECRTGGREFQILGDYFTRALLRLFCK